MQCLHYGHQIQTYIFPSRTPFLACLFDNMLVCPFVCFLSLFASLVCLPSAFFVSLLSLLLVCQFCIFFDCCMYTFRVKAQLLKCKLKREKMQAKEAILKRAMINKLGGLASPCDFSLSLSIFFRTMSIAFYTRAFFPCILLGPHSQGMAMSDLYISCTLLGPYLQDIGNVWFVFLLYVCCIV